jgi:hypothetical protein
MAFSLIMRGSVTSAGLRTTVYLVYLGVGSALVGPLLWPAAALHGALTIILVRGWLGSS